MNGSAIWGASAAATIGGIEVSPADPLPVARAVRAEPVEIHYAPEEDLEAIDVALIGSAQLGPPRSSLYDKRVLPAGAPPGARPGQSEDLPVRRARSQD